MKERRWSYIFRWHNFLELVQSELLLALPHVLPEDLLQPGDVLLVENSSLPARRGETLLLGVVRTEEPYRGLVITITKDMNSSTVVLSSPSLSMQRISFVTTPRLDQIWGYSELE